MNGFGFPMTPDCSSQMGSSFADYEDKFFAPQSPSKPKFDSSYSCISPTPERNWEENNFSRNTTHNIGRSYQHNKKR